jgi:hypothetical protein
MARRTNYECQPTLLGYRDRNDGGDGRIKSKKRMREGTGRKETRIRKGQVRKLFYLKKEEEGKKKRELNGDSTKKV